MGISRTGREGGGSLKFSSSLPQRFGPQRHPFLCPGTPCSHTKAVTVSLPNICGRLVASLHHLFNLIRLGHSNAWSCANLLLLLHQNFTAHRTNSCAACLVSTEMLKVSFSLSSLPPNAFTGPADAVSAADITNLIKQESHTVHAKRSSIEE